MRSIIFSNYSAFDTRRLGATIDVEHSNLRFLNNMTLNLWDCAGQDAFMENFLNNSSPGTGSSSNIFRKCEVLIYVFDVESKEVQKDIEIFTRVLQNLQRDSPDVKIFILVHKMDLIQFNRRKELFDMMFGKLQEIATNEYNFQIRGFATSIWDESLYKAWSSIVCSLIPNISLYEKHLVQFNQILNAKEIVLFEKTTFLVISAANQTSSSSGLTPAQINKNGKSLAQPTRELDPKRFEKIFNIIKTFKQSVSKLRTSFSNLILEGGNVSIYLEALTNNIYIMIILDHRTDNSGYRVDDQNLVLENIKKAREWFEKIESSRTTS